METKQLKRYPYFTAWLEELGRSPEEVEGIGIEAEIEETHPVGNWKMHKRTDNFTASLTFANGDVFQRPGKFSDGTMTYVEAKGDTDEQDPQEAAPSEPHTRIPRAHPGR